MKKINIVVSCTAGKNLESVLMYDNYMPGEAQEWLDDAVLEFEKMKAINLYKGPGADKFRAIKALLEEKYEVDLWILSAGFGIVHQDTELPGYDATFSSMAKFNRVRPADFKEWLRGVTRKELPRDSIIMLPNSYLKPFKAIEDIDNHIQLGPFGGEAREAIGCSMIRVQLEACELIVKYALDRDIAPEYWNTIDVMELV